MTFSPEDDRSEENTHESLEVRALLGNSLGFQEVVQGFYTVLIGTC